MRRLLFILSMLAALAALALAPPSFAAKRSGGKDGGQVELKSTGTNYNKGKALAIGQGEKLHGQPPLGPGKVGEVRTWLALDDFRNRIYLKNYTLRGVGQHAEVWVANNLDFSAGDCRNGVRTAITDTQVNYFIQQFDGNIYPKESATFSVPPQRDGHNAILPKLIPNLPSSEYKGEGDNIVVLIDNVRDANYYDTNNAHAYPYIAGFFYSVFNEYFDRNVMSVDAFDWLHRTGANPPDEPVPGDNCASAPARPFLYEGVFAHEYQHLLEYYEDTDEVNWVNEGLSDFAILLTGYGDPRVPITSTGFDNHIQCFLGYLGVLTPANPNPRDGGPENSLTRWGDQGDGEILCDYGAAYSFMLFMQGRYGNAFMSALHRQDLNGFDGLQATLDQFVSGKTALGVLHEWAAMVALDSVLDHGAALTGGTASTYMTGSLDASINWSTANAYSTAGAPPNGSDYVRLRNASGQFLAAGSITSISCNGDSTLPPKPVEWTVDSSLGALYSGSAPNLDRAIVRSVTVPATTPTLTFDTQYNTEVGFDYGIVQVSTDGGATYHSLGNADTTTAHDSTADPRIVAQLPGFNGDSGGFRSETFDLSAYAGQTILLAFRYMTDPGVDLPGWWIDNVTVGGTLVSDGTSLAGWQSPTQVRRTPVAGFTVQLIAYKADGTAAWIKQLPLDANFDGSLSGAALQAAIGTSAETVAAIVTYDDRSESSDQYAPYTLTVNGVVQPGGR